MVIKSRIDDHKIKIIEFVCECGNRVIVEATYNNVHKVWFRPLYCKECWEKDNFKELFVKEMKRVVRYE